MGAIFYKAFRPCFLVVPDLGRREISMIIVVDSCSTSIPKIKYLEATYEG